MKNSFLKMPFLFDQSNLKLDLQHCLKFAWKNHFNQNDYTGSWTVISLRSQSGTSGDISANDSDQEFKDTDLMGQCLYFKKIIDEFLFEKETIRLLCLKPKSVIKEHRDMGLAYRYGSFRLHIPLQTDAEVAFLVGGKNIPMKQGECWYADFDQPHSVINESSKERIHLVIDGKRNTWADQLFRESGYDFEEEKKQNDYSIETKKQMIEQLRFLKTPVAEDMIRKLELELLNK